MYSLHIAWLTIPERRRLDAFQAKALRKILGIAPSYYSRVSNADVLKEAGCPKASSMLLLRQLHFLGQLATRDENDILKRCVFEHGSHKLRTFPSSRKRGRPRDTWAAKLLQEANLVAGSYDRLIELWQDTPVAKSAWRRACQKHIFHTNA